MGVSDLRGERTTVTSGIPSVLRPLMWGGHNLSNASPNADAMDAGQDAMDVVQDAADETMNGDHLDQADADMGPAYADEDQHDHHHQSADRPAYYDDIENDRRAFNQTAFRSASASAAGPTGFSGPHSEDAKPNSRLSAPLNHHTPVTRFLSKQTLGFIPKLSARPSPLSYVPDSGPNNAAENNSSSNSNANSESLTSPLGGGFRLPSLSSTPPLSPQKWTGADDRFPPFLGPPQRVSSCGSLSDKFATMSTLSSPRTGAIPSLKEALERGAAGGLRSDSGASTVSSVGSPPSALPTGMLTMQDICRPMPYQRSASCPSDPTVSSALLSAVDRAAAERALPFSAVRFVDDAAADGGAPLSSPSSSFGSCSPRSSGPQSQRYEADYEESEDDGARSVGLRSPPPPQTEYQTLSLRDITQSRVERSSSVDGSPSRLSRPAAESIDLYQWLDRDSLHSLAESAHAVQMLEQRDRHIVSVPSASASASASAFGLPSLPADGSGSEQHEARREKKLCAFPQCSSNAVTRGLCISHGGGRRCQRKGCTRGAQSKGLCVAHGGGRICRAKGCSNIQRSMGLCIRHGGGRRCCVPGCQKGVVRQDLCTAHGGKRKCRIEDCNKHVKKKGLCRAHANSLYQSGGNGGGGSPA